MNSTARPDIWQTLLSDKDSIYLQFVRIIDEKDLLVELSWKLSESGGIRARIRFTNPLAYRLIREELLIGETVDVVSAGPTVKYSQSTWLREIRDKAPNIDKTWNPLTHYIIFTPEQQLEVVCSDEPLVEEIS